MGVTIDASFSLLNHEGERVAHSDYRGKFMLVYFGFTHCRIVCPRSLARLSAILDDIGAHAANVAPLYVTVDPARDTPERMKAYLEASYPRFTGLTGTEEEIAGAKRAFRIFAEKKADAADPDGYAVPHTAIAYLIGPDGVYRDHFTDGLDAQTVRTRLLKALVSG